MSYVCFIKLILYIIGNPDHCNNELIKTIIEPVQHAIRVCIFIVYIYERYQNIKQY